MQCRIEVICALHQALRPDQLMGKHGNTERLAPHKDGHRANLIEQESVTQERSRTNANAAAPCAVGHSYRKKVPVGEKAGCQTVRINSG
ncbi:MAG: hypothetical protein OXC07_02145 [Kistimonas sp.]|nr:hypothetical protein [Kistimonas sp.]